MTREIEDKMPPFVCHAAVIPPQPQPAQQLRRIVNCDTSCLHGSSNFSREIGPATRGATVVTKWDRTSEGEGGKRVFE